jgi:hypothetical protein
VFIKSFIPAKAGIQKKRAKFRKEEGKKMKKRTSNIQHRTSRKEPSKCEDCSYSVPAGGKGVGILTCRNKAGGPGRMWVVDNDGHCKNFTRDKELLAPELVQALAEGAKLIPLTQDKFAIVDPKDYDQLGQYKWYAKKGGNTYYAARGVRVYKDGKYVGVKQILMHRVITNAPAGMMVDHRDHNGLNNRRSNLRLCTREQNAQNSVANLCPLR